MTLMTDNYLPDEQLEKIAGALNNGLIVVDLNGRIVWIDENTRQTINGGLQELAFPLAQHDLALDCFLSPVEVTVNGQRKTLCVIQQTAEQREASSDFIAAIEAVLSDSSWFTRTIVEKLKAWRQAKQPSTRPSDLDLLTDREREILALICEGRSDAEMSRMLRLSQNTVRNHVASLYRKIGVNRRSAAIIWARERAITSYEFAASGARPRRRDRHA